TTVTNRGAVDQRHHRLLHAAHRADQAVEVLAHVLFDVFEAAHAARGHGLEIQARAEVAALAGEHHTADRLVGGGAVERLDEGAIDRVGQAILRFRPVEGDPAHAGFVRHFQVAHPLLPPEAILALPMNALMPAATYWIPLTLVHAADMMPNAPTK